jgi:hypothetical protein
VGYRVFRTRLSSLTLPHVKRIDAANWQGDPPDTLRALHKHDHKTRGVTIALELIGGGVPPVPWRPSPIPRPAEPPVRLTVDGEVFDVTTQPDHPGHYHYAWISGPNPGYGFSSASSDGRQSSMVDHEEAIRNFLSHVDRETGYIG